MSHRIPIPAIRYSFSVHLFLAHVGHRGMKSAQELVGVRARLTARFRACEGEHALECRRFRTQTGITVRSCHQTTLLARHNRISRDCHSLALFQGLLDDGVSAVAQVRVQFSLLSRYSLSLLVEPCSGVLCGSPFS